MSRFIYCCAECNYAECRYTECRGASQMACAVKQFTSVIYNRNKASRLVLKAPEECTLIQTTVIIE
jgi:hypothetical protein